MRVTVGIGPGKHTTFPQHSHKVLVRVAAASLSQSANFMPTFPQCFRADDGPMIGLGAGGAFGEHLGNIL